jgi:hypothetical protein
MNAPDTILDVEAADDFSPLGRQERLPQASRGSAKMMATQRETAVGCAGSGNAAAPTFTIMALLTGVPGGGPRDMLLGPRKMRHR